MQYFSSPGRFMFYYVVCFNTFKFKCNLDTSSNLIKPDRFDHKPTVMTPPPPKKGHKMISFTWYYIYIVQLLYVHVQFKLLYNNILSCKQCLCPNSLHHLHIDFFPVMQTVYHPVNIAMRCCRTRPILGNVQVKIYEN